MLETLTLPTLSLALRTSAMTSPVNVSAKIRTVRPWSAPPCSGRGAKLANFATLLEDASGGVKRDFNETAAVAMSTKPTSIGSEQTSDENRNISERQSAATYNNDETQKDGRTQSYERTEMRGQR